MPVLERALLLQLLPRDANDRRGVVVEVRAGTGGDEACLFALELYRMYERYAASQGWKFEVGRRGWAGRAWRAWRRCCVAIHSSGMPAAVPLCGAVSSTQPLPAHHTCHTLHPSPMLLQPVELAENDLGGCKLASAAISGGGGGGGVYGRLKFESGIHRVQRVPATESGAAWRRRGKGSEEVTTQEMWLAWPCLWTEEARHQLSRLHAATSPARPPTRRCCCSGAGAHQRCLGGRTAAGG